VVPPQAEGMSAVQTTHCPSSHAGASGSFASHCASLVHGTHTSFTHTGTAASPHSLDSTHAGPIVVDDELSDSLTVVDSVGVVASELAAVIVSVVVSVSDELDPSAIASHSASSPNDFPSPHGE